MQGKEKGQWAVLKARLSVGSWWKVTLKKKKEIAKRRKFSLLYCLPLLMSAQKNKTVVNGSTKLIIVFCHLCAVLGKKKNTITYFEHPSIWRFIHSSHGKKYSSYHLCYTLVGAIQI
jgi:hypothetical protein